MAERSAEKAGRMDGWELRGAWCQMCGPARTHCYTRCYVKDGEWLRVEGCPKAGNNGVFGGVSLCAKGNAAPRSLPSENRLTTPLRRIGAKGPGARFERIGWDEALDQIAETMLEQKESYGPESFGILSPQFYSPLATLGRRLLNVHGSPNYLHSALCMVQRSASANTVVGGLVIFANNSTIPAQLDKTELLMCWGENVESAGVNQGGARRRVEQMERGMKVIDIRPLRDPLAAKADIWLPVRPGTDLALALGFLNVICGEGLYDRDFAREWCNGFPELCEHVRPYTPEWAEERCGIPAEQIREVARMIAAAKPAPSSSAMASATRAATGTGPSAPCSSSAPSAETSASRAAGPTAAGCRSSSASGRPRPCPSVWSAAGRTSRMAGPPDIRSSSRRSSRAGTSPRETAAPPPATSAAC